MPVGAVGGGSSNVQAIIQQAKAQATAGKTGGKDVDGDNDGSTAVNDKDGGVDIRA